ncbi:hypothetical protein Pmani_010521 [Petrolisthes manimaculis]|uniref:Uncharacterized protein n=1 Tax=Petrolisthes manimaculis TaxID=1843537 RepID=A0AAE1Q2X5_9EUCA|nr:hypothetical protein Pmani_010521 [Petrolisthes manimaculis]
MRSVNSNERRLISNSRIFTRKSSMLIPEVPKPDCLVQEAKCRGLATASVTLLSSSTSFFLKSRLCFTPPLSHLFCEVKEPTESLGSLSNNWTGTLCYAQVVGQKIQCIKYNERPKTLSKRPQTLPLAKITPCVLGELQELLDDHQLPATTLGGGLEKRRRHAALAYHFPGSIQQESACPVTVVELVEYSSEVIMKPHIAYYSAQ